jgi:hypothetical protein
LSIVGARSKSTGVRPFECSMDYQLKPLGKTCSQTGKPLEPGEACYSAVVEKGNEWVRLDFSASAWAGPPEGALGFWKATVPARDQTGRRALDADALLRLFEQLSEDGNPGREKFRYVLALLLVQRRRLRITQTRSDAAGAVLELTGLQGEGPFEVRDQQLAESEVAALQQELETSIMAEPNS